MEHVDVEPHHNFQPSVFVYRKSPRRAWPRPGFVQSISRELEKSPAESQHKNDKHIGSLQSSVPVLLFVQYFVFSPSYFWQHSGRPVRTAWSRMISFSASAHAGTFQQHRPWAMHHGFLSHAPLMTRIQLPARRLPKAQYWQRDKATKHIGNNASTNMDKACNATMHKARDKHEWDRATRLSSGRTAMAATHATARSRK